MGRAREVVGQFDIDFKRRCSFAPLHSNHDFLRIEHDVPRNDGKDLCRQQLQQFRLAAPAACASSICNRSRATRAEALRPRITRSIESSSGFITSSWGGVRAGQKFTASTWLAFTLYAIMAKSPVSVKRKKPGRPATGTEPLYGIRLADGLMKQIMDWAKSQGATRSVAIRRLIELGLKAKSR